SPMLTENRANLSPSSKRSAMRRSRAACPAASSSVQIVSLIFATLSGTDCTVKGWPPQQLKLTCLAGTADCNPARATEPGKSCRAAEGGRNAILLPESTTAKSLVAASLPAMFFALAPAVERLEPKEGNQWNQTRPQHRACMYGRVIRFRPVEGITFTATLVLLALSLSPGAVMLDERVDLGTDEDHEPCEIEPEHQDDDRPD